jgi:hypothetical protein
MAMRDVAIIGVGAHATGQFAEKELKEIAYPAVWNAIGMPAFSPQISMWRMSAIRSAAF